MFLRYKSKVMGQIGERMKLSSDNLVGIIALLTKREHLTVASELF